MMTFELRLPMQKMTKQRANVAVQIFAYTDMAVKDSVKKPIGYVAPSHCLFIGTH